MFLEGQNRGKNLVAKADTTKGRPAGGKQSRVTLPVRCDVEMQKIREEVLWCSISQKKAVTERCDWIKPQTQWSQTGETSVNSLLSLCLAFPQSFCPFIRGLEHWE